MRHEYILCTIRLGDYTGAFLVGPSLDFHAEVAFLREWLGDHAVHAARVLWDGVQVKSALSIGIVPKDSASRLVDDLAGEVDSAFREAS